MSLSPLVFIALFLYISLQINHFSSFILFALLLVIQLCLIYFTFTFLLCVLPLLKISFSKLIRLCLISDVNLKFVDGDNPIVFHRQNFIGQAVYTNMNKISVTVFVDLVRHRAGLGQNLRPKLGLKLIIFYLN